MWSEVGYGRDDYMLMLASLQQDGADWDAVKQEIGWLGHHLKEQEEYFHIATSGPSSLRFNRNHHGRPEAISILTTNENGEWEGYVFSRNATSHQDDLDFYHMIRFGHNPVWNRATVEDVELCLPLPKDRRPSSYYEHIAFYQELLETYHPGKGRLLDDFGNRTNNPAAFEAY